MQTRATRIAIESFLEQFVEGYLFSDLVTMATSGPERADKPGHLGYSMALVCCSGIELLGSLADDRQFSRKLGSEYFSGYWSRFLYPDQASLGPPVYRLIRHGLAHAFITRRNVLVTKGQPDVHLSFTEGRFHLDVTAFASDLERSYRDRFRPFLDVERAQHRLDERLKQWTDESDDWTAVRATSRKGNAEPTLRVDLPVSGHPNWPPGRRVIASGWDTAVNSPAPGSDVPEK